MKYLARIDINFDGSISTTNEHPAKVPSRFFCAWFDSIGHAKRELNQAGIPWNLYQWNPGTQKRDFVSSSTTSALL